jgi:hypothetical protein
MQKLPLVEEAKALMHVASDWSIWHWLTDKKRVRRTADAGTEALNELEKQVKAAWGEDLKAAYQELEAQVAYDANPRLKRQLEKAQEAAKDVDPQIKLMIKKVKQADDIAYNARMDAEDTFDEAERKLSAGLARQGAFKAIEAYDLREKAIRRAEAVARKQRTPA